MEIHPDAPSGFVTVPSARNDPILRRILSPDAPGAHPQADSVQRLHRHMGGLPLFSPECAERIMLVYHECKEFLKAKVSPTLPTSVFGAPRSVLV